MSDMSPLAALILRVMRAGCIMSAGFVVLVIGIEIWKRWRFGGFEGLSRQDISFYAILLAMLMGLLWLCRSISRELAKSGS